MIPRYTRPEMAAIWDPQTRFRIWFEIEAHATDALAELGVVPKEAAQAIWAKGRDASFDIDRIDAIEREVKHDVIAFLTHLAEIVGPEARYVHQGMTSSDVLDTCLNVQLTRAADLLIADVDRLLAALKRRALRTQDDARRSAAPTASMPSPPPSGLSSLMRMRNSPAAATGLSPHAGRSRPARFPARSAPSRRSPPPWRRMSPRRWGSRSSRSRPRSSRATAMRCILPPLGWSPRRWSGLPPKFGICSAPRCWRRRSISRPAKKAPRPCRTSATRCCRKILPGLARMVRAYVNPALENVALWHERDISHSSVERMIGPDATVTLDFALNRLAGLIERLVVYPENMRKNLDRLGGLVHSQRVLLALTQKGASREEAYGLVQRNAMKVWEAGGDFQHLLAADPDVRKYLSEAEIAANFDLGYHFKEVDTIFGRVFG